MDEDLTMGRAWSMGSPPVMDLWQVWQRERLTHVTPLQSLEPNGMIFVPTQMAMDGQWRKGCEEGTLDRQDCHKFAAKVISRDIEKCAGVLTPGMTYIKSLL